MKARLLPWSVPLALAVWMIVASLPPSSPPDRPAVHEFGKIPVTYNGRVKPMDTLARNVLKIISGRETFRDLKGRRRLAIEWLLDALAAVDDPERRAFQHRVFRIFHPQVIHELGLTKRKGYRYAADEFAERLPNLDAAEKRALARKKAKLPLDAYERQILELGDRWRYFDALVRRSIPQLVPPLKEGEEWKPLNQGDPAADPILQMLSSYAGNKHERFNTQLAEYLSRLESGLPSDNTKARFEAFFNHANPFGKCIILYLVALVLSFLAWLGWSGPLNRSAFILLWLAFTVHTLALVARIYLSGRPPVTNLYSSAVFVGWGCVLLGFLLERFDRTGISNLISAIAGAVTLMIARALAAEGDTMEVLRAVLDSQFWLATHVTTIAVGYSANYVAGLIGVIFILRGILTRTMTMELREDLARMIYGTICFGTFFSLTGTILGGLWADDSWGRFWGWDPKENGALMLVLWNALILHARWGRLVRERGLAVLAVLGNIVVTWSWFGVNQLGVGLHTYGFTSGTTLWLALFVASQVLVMGIGLIPERFWRSREAHAEGR